MTVDSNARRQAILYEVAAVATRYEQDTPPAEDYARLVDLVRSWERVSMWSNTMDVPGPILELAGRCVAWLEHLAKLEVKACDCEDPTLCERRATTRCAFDAS